MQLDRNLGPVAAFFVRLGCIVGPLFLIGLYLDYLGIATRHYCLMAFSAIVLAAAMLPAVRQLKRWGVPKTLSIVGLYGIFFGAMFGVVLLVKPMVASDLDAASQRMPQIAERLAAQADKLSAFAATYDIQIDLKKGAGISKETLMPHLNEAAQIAGTKAKELVASTVHLLVSVVIVLLFGFFLTEEDHFLQDTSASTADDSQTAANAEGIVDRIMTKIGRWARTQLLIALIFGTLTGLSLRLIGVEFSLTIGVAAVVLEMIPFVGGVTAVIMAVGVTLAQFDHPMVPLIEVVSAWLLITLLTHKVISPKLMESFLGIHKLWILIALIIGAESFGMMGALLAVPSVIVFKELWMAAKAARQLKKTQDDAMWGASYGYSVRVNWPSSVTAAVQPPTKTDKSV